MNEHFPFPGVVLVLYVPGPGYFFLDSTTKNFSCDPNEIFVVFNCGYKLYYPGEGFSIFRLSSDEGTYYLFPKPNEHDFMLRVDGRSNYEVSKEFCLLSENLFSLEN